jgi:hypothetical protein
MWSGDVDTDQPPRQSGGAVSASVVDVDAVKAVNSGVVKHLAPGVIADFGLRGARIVVDRGDENLGPIRVAGQGFGIVELHQHGLSWRARSVESIGERWLSGWACERREREYRPGDRVVCLNHHTIIISNRVNQVTVLGPKRVH